ncbi:hypothetical protein EQ249_07925 [Citrobacter freundii]|uniref:hypothetical protein n=1 Tax=Citrobacter freundii TaxID=546 RepID=UPI000D03B58B|nr:hypothetical protein [Citrobacter freundii]QAT69540.1 hypothetical protein EQ249_07925 [Citrobacter freundii]
MTSRERFEAWYLENWGHTEDDHETLFERDPDSDEEYYRLGVRMAHRAWQASEEELAVQLANAESKCRELAAENAALKKAAEFSTAEDMWIEQADGMLDYRYVDWYVDVLKAAMETPVTDAFLAEVRAQGVEMFGQYHNFSEKLFIQKESKKFATQLRKGASL